MSNKKKYLYFYRGFGDKISRILITRETDKTLWLQSANSEFSLRKNNLCRGSGFDHTTYYHETSELLEEYITEVKYQMFRNKLDKMQKLGRTKITSDLISKVLDIKLPLVENENKS